MLKKRTKIYKPCCSISSIVISQHIACSNTISTDLSWELNEILAISGEHITISLQAVWNEIEIFEIGNSSKVALLYAATEPKLHYNAENGIIDR